MLLPANSNGCYERNEDGSAVSYDDLEFALLKYRGTPEGEKIDINTYQTQNLLDFLLMEMNALWTSEVLATSSPGGLCTPPTAVRWDSRQLQKVGDNKGMYLWPLALLLIFAAS